MGYELKTDMSGNVCDKRRLNRRYIEILRDGYILLNPRVQTPYGTRKTRHYRWDIEVSRKTDTDASMELIKFYEIFSHPPNVCSLNDDSKLRPRNFCHCNSTDSFVSPGKQRRIDRNFRTFLSFVQLTQIVRK